MNTRARRGLWLPDAAGDAAQLGRQAGVVGGGSIGDGVQPRGAGRVADLDSRERPAVTALQLEQRQTRRRVFIIASDFAEVQLTTRGSTICGYLAANLTPTIPPIEVPWI